jgi:hypothetical protein
MKKIHWMVALCWLILVASCSDKGASKQLPNVILIISDQWSTKVADGSGNYDNGLHNPIPPIPCVPLLEPVFSRDFILIIMMLAST